MGSTTQQLHYPFADVAVVLSSENTNDKKSIVHTLSLKEVFVGKYKKKGLGLLGA